MLKKTAYIIASLTLGGTLGCASQQHAVPEVEEAVVQEREQRLVAQDDLEVVQNERVAGFWGESGWLIRIGEEEFVVHRPDDGEVVARKSVSGRLVSASISPAGDFACVLHGPGTQGSRLSLYDVERDEWRWEEGLMGSAYMVVAGVDKCLIGYDDRSPEVFEAPDGKARVRLMEMPSEPMGVFTSKNGYRQWWVSPVEDYEPAAGEEAGTRWEVSQVEIRSWTLEGKAVARCVFADEGQIMAVANEAADGPALAEMARRAQMGYSADGCEPAGPDEMIRFADGEHRLSRTIPDADDAPEGLSEEVPEQLEGVQRPEGAPAERPSDRAEDVEEEEVSEEERSERLRRRSPRESVIQRGAREIRRMPFQVR